MSARGAGRSIARTAPVAKIAAAVGDILMDPAYGRAAASLGAAVRRDAAGPALITELEALPHSGPTGRGRSA